MSSTVTTPTPPVADPTITPPVGPTSIGPDPEYDPNSPEYRSAANVVSRLSGRLWDAIKEGIPAFNSKFEAAAHTDTGTLANGETPKEQLITPEAAMTPKERKAHPILTGVGESLGSFTSPENVITMAGTGGFGELPGAAGKLIPKLLSLKFSADAIKGAYAQIPDFKAAMDRGDESEAERIIAHIVTDTAVGADVGQHAVKGAFGEGIGKLDTGRTFTKGAEKSPVEISNQVESNKRVDQGDLSPSDVRALRNYWEPRGGQVSTETGVGGAAGRKGFLHTYLTLPEKTGTEISNQVESSAAAPAKDFSSVGGVKVERRSPDSLGRTPGSVMKKVTDATYQTMREHGLDTASPESPAASGKFASVGGVEQRAATTFGRTGGSFGRTVDQTYDVLRAQEKPAVEVSNQVESKKITPQKWYHGTSAENTTKIEKAGQLTPGQESQYGIDVPRKDAVYVTSDPEIAKTYAGPGGKTHEVQVDTSKLIPDEDSVVDALNHGRETDTGGTYVGIQKGSEGIAKRVQKFWLDEFNKNAVANGLPKTSDFRTAWEELYNPSEGGPFEGPSELAEDMKDVAEKIAKNDPKLSSDLIEATGKAAHLGPTKLVKSGVDISNQLESNVAAPAIHPDLQKLSDKYGVSDDPEKVRNGASFIRPDGKFVHLPAGMEHDRALQNVFPEKLTDRGYSGPLRMDVIKEGAIRSRFHKGRGGDTLSFSVPEKGVNEEQIQAMKDGFRTSMGGRGNLVMEIGTPNGKSTQADYVTANEIEPALARIGAMPNQRVNLSDAYGDTGTYIGGHVPLQAGKDFPGNFEKDNFTSRRTTGHNMFDPEGFITGEEMAKGMTPANSHREFPSEEEYQNTVHSRGVNVEDVAKKYPRVFNESEVTNPEVRWDDQAKGAPKGTTNRQVWTENVGVTHGPELLEIPKNRLGEQGNTLTTIHHEIGHIVVAHLLGVPMDGVEIQSHLHPDNYDRGAAAATKFDFSKLPGATKTANGASFTPEGLAKAFPQLLRTLLGGGAAEDLLDGIDIRNNQGMGGDLHQIQNVGRAAKVPQFMMDTKISRAMDQTKEMLNTPEILDIIKNASATREEGLSKTLHMSKERVQRDIIQKLNEVISGKRTDDLSTSAGDIAGTVRGADQGIGEAASSREGQVSGGAAGGNEPAAVQSSVVSKTARKKALTSKSK